MTQTSAPRRRTRRWLVVGLAVVVLAAAGLWWAYRSLSGNIDTVDPAAGLGDVRPAKENESLNILLIGSDTREGSNSAVGGESPGLADTTIVLHLAADNSWATGVSIPRDSMVEMPDCVESDGSTYPGGLRQFNQAYVIGGPVCVQRTVEALTDLRIDHFVVVDFSGFVDMVDALDGITVYVQEPISDPSSDIYFDVGCQTLDGKQALDYVRVRHGVGDGSDLGRIDRQQQFLAAVVQEVTSRGILLNPVALYQFLDAGTSAVTTDTALGSIQDMASVAVRVRDVGLGDIEFTTVPVRDWPPDPNRVEWKQPDADELWEHLRDDVALTPEQPDPSASAEPSESDEPASATPTPSPTGSFDVRGADEPVCPTP